MKKALIFSLALLLAGGVAYANYCARDVVPAATLLVPYVTVDLDALSGQPDPNGKTTILGVTNVSREAVIIHITAWDATSVARIDFNEILSGYDVWQINFRDLLNGRFDIFDTSRTDFTLTGAPATATFDPFEWGPDGRGQGGQDGNTATQPVGENLEVPQNRSAILAADCVEGPPPYGNRPELATMIQDALGTPFLSVPKVHAGCGTLGLRGDKQSYPATITGDPLFFYVTVDVVRQCNLRFPSDDVYWTSNYPTQENVLIGDVLYFDGTNRYSEAFPAVHIEADLDYAAAVFNFYEEKTSPVADPFVDREPLATAFGFRYADDDAAGLGTNAILWKNFAEFTAGGAVDDCGSYLYYAWDNDERSLSRTTQPISGLPSGGLDRNQFPWETQSVAISDEYFDLPANYGWILFVLPPSYPMAGGIYTDPTTATAVSDRPYMGWMGVQLTFGNYSAGVEAATMANAHCFPNQTLPFLGANNGVAPVWP